MNRKVSLWAVLVALASVAAHAATSRLDDIIPAGSVPARIATGFKFTEGPVWHPAGYLLFSDVRDNKMYRWSAAAGTSMFRDPSGFANGNAFDAAGNLYTCQHDRKLTRTAPDGNITVLADKYDGKRLNSPNDLVLASDGTLYFTDPHYGLIGVGPEIAPEEQPVRGVYKLTPDGKLIRMVESLGIPNGVALSPDESKLYIADSATGNLFVMPRDGASPPELFAEQPLPPGAEPLADGIKVDAKGNVYAASREGISIFNAIGLYLGHIALPERVSNMAWGDDGKTLYITASTSVYAIKTRFGKP